MTFDQVYILGLLVLALILFISERWRFDMVALAALFAGVLGGVIDPDRAFDGFAHPAVITVAAVLIISQALSNTGAVDVAARRLMPETRNLTVIVISLCSLGAFLSAFMNNVGALVLLMPVAIQVAGRLRRPPAALLMPLAFATILGGLTTLIGTPPNLIIAGYRAEVRGEPFGMFDFGPVGLAVAAAGVIFIGIAGWRLIPMRRRRRRTQRQVFDIDDYVAEAQVPPGSQLIGLPFRSVEEAIYETGEISVVGLIRADEKINILPHRRLAAGDILVLEGEPDALTHAGALYGLTMLGSERDVARDLASDEINLAEAVVGPRSRLRGQSLGDLRFRDRYHVNVIAVSREGRPYRGRLSSFRARAGDVLLVQGERARLDNVITALGMLRIAGRVVSADMRRAAVTAGAFALAIAATTLGLLPPAVAFIIAAAVMVGIGAVKADDAYNVIDWPVIVLLGALIPVGHALETTGATGLVAETLTMLVGGGGGGAAGLIALVLVMLVTTALSAVINNAATAVVMGPIAISLAKSTGSNADGFLMGVAVAASCAFLTPVGHQNNTLVMGPGGYHFGDYVRLGLPLTLLVLAVAIPMIWLVWGI